MSGGKFGLCGAKFAGQIVEPGTELLDQCLGGDQARRQLGDFILLLRVLSMTLLDLLDDVRPIDLVGDGLAGSEPTKQVALRLGPQPNVLAIEITIDADMLDSGWRASAAGCDRSTRTCSAGRGGR